MLQQLARRAGADLELSLDFLAEKGVPAARPLFRLLAFFEPSPIPVAVLHADVMAAAPPFAGLTTADIRDEALRTGLYPCPPTSGNAYSRAFLERVMPIPHVQCGADGLAEEARPAVGDAKDLVTERGRPQYHRTDRGIEPGGVAAAGENSDAQG